MPNKKENLYCPDCSFYLNKATTKMKGVKYKLWCTNCLEEFLYFFRADEFQLIPQFIRIRKFEK